MRFKLVAPEFQDSRKRRRSREWNHGGLPQPFNCRRAISATARVIELQITLPVVHGRQRVAGALAQEGQVEVGVGVVGVEPPGPGGSIQMPL